MLRQMDRKTKLPSARAGSAGAHHRPRLEPVTQHITDQFASQAPLHSLSPEAARDILARRQAAPVGKPAATITDIVLPVGPTGSVEVRIVRPLETAEPAPVVMYFHGGGWMMGDRQTHDRFVREIAIGADVAVVFVEYDRAPECQFPIAVEQAYAATKYVAEQGRSLNVDASRLAVLGDGAGGNLAAVVALLAKERRGPKIDLQLLFYPVTDANFDTASYRRFAKGPVLTRKAMRRFWDAYLPGIDGRADRRATPLNATIAQLRNLPDAFIVLAEFDVLRDEGEAYARKLCEAGVRVTSVRYNATVHEFIVLNALADTPATRGAIAQTIGALKASFD